MSVAALVARAVVRAPGTCGELVQGFLEGFHFHVTCPIDVSSTVTVDVYRGASGVTGPASCPKAVKGVRLALLALGAEGLSAELSIRNPLPRSKGMASSTADVAGSIAATGLALQKPFSPADIARLSLQVEPSDGLMFPGITLFGHRDGNPCEALGAPPAMNVLVLDFGGTVDTVVFNSRDLTEALRARSMQWRECLELIRGGIVSADISQIGLGATLDSITYSEVVPRPQLDSLLALAKELGAVGVNTAHSGTVMGLLLPPDEELLVRAEREARWRFPGLESVYRTRLVGGGVQTLAT
ncbi:MAG: kinase [Dehalococcoidia bacterium]|nr:kinase [Dehalococcoidia bacterium]